MHQGSPSWGCKTSPMVAPPNRDGHPRQGDIRAEASARLGGRSAMATISARERSGRSPSGRQGDNGSAHRRSIEETSAHETAPSCAERTRPRAARRKGPEQAREARPGAPGPRPAGASPGDRGQQCKGPRRAPNAGDRPPPSGVVKHVRSTSSSANSSPWRAGRERRGSPPRPAQQERRLRVADGQGELPVLPGGLRQQFLPRRCR